MVVFSSAVVSDAAYMKRIIVLLTEHQSVIAKKKCYCFVDILNAICKCMFLIKQTNKTLHSKDYLLYTDEETEVKR